MLRTKIRISPLFFSVLTVFLLLDKSGISGTAVLFSALHELGHFFALLYEKTRPKLIEISLFGIEIRLPENLSTAKKCFVLTAGFALNFILATMFFIIEKPLLAYINLIIGIFTSLPLSATDGGAILRTVLDEYFPQRGERIFRNVSLLFFP